jgi:hypothetical protein
MIRVLIFLCFSGLISSGQNQVDLNYHDLPAQKEVTHTIDMISLHQFTGLNCDTNIYDTLNLCFGDSILLEGAYQKVTGTYIDSFLTTGNCDSVITTYLTALSPDLTEYDLEICDDDSVYAGGAYQNTSGVYYDSLVNSYGCDSVIKTTIQIRSTYTFPRYQVICQGDSLFLGGAYQDSSGVYYDTIQTVFGCDSVLLTQLQVDTITSSNDSIYLCQGDSLLMFGQYISTPGIYTDTISSIGGCDSILTVHLLNVPLFNTLDTVEICEGDSFLINGSFHTTQGNYLDSLLSIFGCDSLVDKFLKVNSLPFPSITFNDPLIQTTGFNSYQWHLNNAQIPGAVDSIHTVNINGAYFIQVSDSNGCFGYSDTLQINNLSVNELIDKHLFIGINYLNNGILIQNVSDETWYLSIYSLDGKLVYSTSKNSYLLESNTLRKGIYFLNAQYHKGVILTSKVVVK